MPKGPGPTKRQLDAEIDQQRLAQGLSPLMVEEADSPEGARNIARMITDYWKGRGYYGIVAAAVPTKRFSANGRQYWDVKSNIGPTGYPPRKALEAVAA